MTDTDTRQVLEEAFKVIHPAPRPIRHAYQPDGSHWPGDGIGPYTEEYGAWSKVLARFRRFLDAEAWTDAALCLVPEGWRCGFEMAGRFDHKDLVEAWCWPWESAFDPDWQCGQQGYRDASDGHRAVADHPALALAQAALRAKEAGDV